MRLKLIISVFFILQQCRIFAQEVELIQNENLELFTDSVYIYSKENYQNNKNRYSIKPYQLIIPSTMIAYGIVGMHNNFLKNLNNDTRYEISEHRLYKVTIDDYTQFAPIMAVYGLKLLGVKSEHNFWQQATVTATAYIVSTALVSTVKYTTKIERPDGSSKNSFPSGHTATAFVGAEILRREYWNVSPFIGMGGYIVAVGIGCFRVFNERHWVTDVVAGGGFGILSANIAYWTLPLFNKILPLEGNKNISLAPFYTGDSGGLAMTINLK